MYNKLRSKMVQACFKVTDLKCFDPLWLRSVGSSVIEALWYCFPSNLRA